jgi:hypothetical protein
MQPSPEVPIGYVFIKIVTELEACHIHKALSNLYK